MEFCLVIKHLSNRVPLKLNIRNAIFGYQVCPSIRGHPCILKLRSASCFQKARLDKAIINVCFGGHFNYIIFDLTMFKNCIQSVCIFSWMNATLEQCQTNCNAFEMSPLGSYYTEIILNITWIFKYVLCVLYNMNNVQNMCVANMCVIYELTRIIRISFEVRNNNIGVRLPNIFCLVAQFSIFGIGIF